MSTDGSRPPHFTCRSFSSCRCRRRRGPRGIDHHHHGEDSVLRQQGHQEGAMGAGGGQAARRLRPGQRTRQLAHSPQARGAEPVRQELPAAVDQLPAPGHQARALHPRGAQFHPSAPRRSRQQVVHDRGTDAGPDGQRDQELLEHAHEEADPPPAPPPATRPSGRPPGSRPRRASPCSRPRPPRRSPPPPPPPRRPPSPPSMRRHPTSSCASGTPRSGILSAAQPRSRGTVRRRARRALACRRCCLSSAVAVTIPRPRRPTRLRPRRTTATRRSWTWRWRSSRCCTAGSARSRRSRRPTCSLRRTAAFSLRLRSSFARSHCQSSDIRVVD
uniref:Uncharacterized protein n=1 Tax=Zea mays TaxID=4577 RepID=A0A804RPU6_MAIZE